MDVLRVGHRLFVLIGVLYLSSCAATAASVETDGKSTGDKAARCTDLSEAACLESGRCTLEPAEPDEGAGEGTGGYRCRPARGPCEEGFHQGSHGSEECKAKTGCRFVPGRCYCPPGVVCICGGGPPPTCIEGPAEDETP